MGLRGTNQEFGRPYNRRIVLEAIRATGPTTRGRIAAEVGLTVQTVSTIIRELEEQGFVLSNREEPRGRGLPPTTLRLNPEGGYAIGSDEAVVKAARSVWRSYIASRSRARRLRHLVPAATVS